MGLLNFLLGPYYQSLFYFLFCIAIAGKYIKFKVILLGSLFLGIGEYAILANIEEIWSAAVGLLFNVFILSFFCYSMKLVNGTVNMKIFKCAILAVIAFFADAITQMLIFVPLGFMYSVSPLEVIYEKPLLVHLAYKSLQVMILFAVWEGELKYAKKFLQKDNRLD